MAKIKEFDKEKESRTWRIWELIGGFLSIITFRPWRDITMRRKIMPTLDDEAPLVALDRLSTEGLASEEIQKVNDLKIYPQIIEMMRLVCEKDGDVSDEEKEFVNKYIENILPKVTTDEQCEEFFELFETVDVSTINIKNNCHLLKANMNRSQIRQFIDAIYMLAYLHDIEFEERRTVDDIGLRIGLGPADIRRSAFAARQEWEKRTGKKRIIDEIKGPTSINLEE